MVIDQKKNLARMRELIELMRNAPEGEIIVRPITVRKYDSVYNISNNGESGKIRSKILAIFNKENVVSSDLDKINELIGKLKDLNVPIIQTTEQVCENSFGQCCRMFEKLAHHKYDLSSEYIKDLKETNMEGHNHPLRLSDDDMNRYKRETLSDFKFYAASEYRFKDRKQWIDLMQSMVREDGLYGWTYWKLNWDDYYNRFNNLR